MVMQCSICNCSWINFWGIWKGFGGGAWFKVGQKKFCLLLSPESEKFEAFHIWMQPCATFVYCHPTPFLTNLSFYGSSKLHLFATTVFQSWGTHPLRTPSTRFNIKKDPTTISGMKKTQLNTLPRASLVWKNRERLWVEDDESPVRIFLVKWIGWVHNLHLDMTKTRAHEYRTTESWEYACARGQSAAPLCTAKDHRMTRSYVHE